MIPDPAKQPTIALWPDAAKALGLGRDRALWLARRGELPVPTFRLGKQIRVPTAALRRALHLDDANGGAPET